MVCEKISRNIENLETYETAPWQVTLPSLPILWENKAGRQSKKNPTESAAF